jgi:DNA-binding IscR family transcriptional regulator
MSTILSNNNNTNNSSKLLTREEVLALARNEYARQLTNYTKAQLLKNKHHESNTKSSPSRGIKDSQAKIQ